MRQDKTEDYRQDWRDMRQGLKPLAVFEASGSREMWQELRMADDSGQHAGLLFWYHNLTDSGLSDTRALAIAADLSTLRQYQSLLQNRDSIPRRVYQRKMGVLFGYSADEIASFLDTDTAKHCQCTLCGRDDSAVRRTQFYNPQIAYPADSDIDKRYQ